METDKVTGNPIPAEEIDERPTLAGNWMDNDWDEINRMDQDAAEPPVPKDLPKEHKREQHFDKPRIVRRMVTRSVFLTAPGGGTQPIPVQLLTHDPNRTLLHIEVYSATATDAVRLSDDAGKMFFDSEAAIIGSFSGGFNLDGYTGTLWVCLPATPQAPYTATGPVLVTVAAVTETIDHG